MDSPAEALVTHMGDTIDSRNPRERIMTSGYGAKFGPRIDASGLQGTPDGDKRYRTMPKPVRIPGFDRLSSSREGRGKKMGSAC